MTTPRRWVIGRASDCDLIADQPEVSSRHCCLFQTEQGFLLEDLQSANGTFVDGVRITSKVRVGPGKRITLGQWTPMPWPGPSDAPGRTVIRVGRASDNDVVLDCPSV